MSRSEQDKEPEPEAMSEVAGSGPAEEAAADSMLSALKSLRYPYSLLILIYQLIEMLLRLAC